MHLGGIYTVGRFSNDYIGPLGKGVKVVTVVRAKGKPLKLPLRLGLNSIGKGNGNPLQCSCLENPRDGGAWWAAVYGVTQSQTRLKRLSSSSSSSTSGRISCREKVEMNNMP